tara:strand:- start:539 stop:1270 length:732 start_codon:yes stop_codon:yes gene_type:complete
MARISTYTVDTTIEKTDKVLGSNIGGQTKNFNMQDIAEWLTSTNAIGSPGCIPYKYSDSGPGDGEMKMQNSNLSELAFPTGDNQILQVSKFPNGGGQSIVAVLNTYLNKDIIISQVQDPSIFAVYNVTAIAQIGEQTKYRLTMDHVNSNNDSNNKGLLNNLYYNIVPWNGAQDKDFKSDFSNSDLILENGEYYFAFTHNLGKFPSITVKISTGQVVEVPVKHINKNESRIFFKGQNSGTVYAN